MLRDTLLNNLGASPQELKLYEHLATRCSPTSDTLKVVSEVDTFLMCNGYTSLIGQLEPTATEEDICTDFMDLVKPCLRCAGDYTQEKAA